MTKSNLCYTTKAIHAGITPDESIGAIMTSIYQTSTFMQEDLGEHKGLAYTRTQNPTRQVSKKYPIMATIHWSGFEDHPNFELTKSQMDDFGDMISFVLKENSFSAAQELVRKVHFFALAESLSGVVSRIAYSATMRHGVIPKQDREQLGIADGLIRLSVGIKGAQDLMYDLKQALS